MNNNDIDYAILPNRTKAAICDVLSLSMGTIGSISGLTKYSDLDLFRYKWCESIASMKAINLTCWQDSLHIFMNGKKTHYPIHESINKIKGL